MTTLDDAVPQLRKVLLAEDHPTMRALLAEALRDAGYDVVEVQDGDALWGQVSAGLEDDDNPREPDLIVSDINMPRQSGLEVLARLRQGAAMTPVILITAFSDEATRSLASRFGAALVLDKPFTINTLVSAAVALVSPG